MSAPEPRPVRFCPVAHGGALFPDLLVMLASVGEPDQYKYLAVLKRECCQGCAKLAIACDPDKCRPALRESLGRALSGDYPVASFARGARARYSAYYDEHVLETGKVRVKGGLFADLAKDLF